VWVHQKQAELKETMTQSRKPAVLKIISNAAEIIALLAKDKGVLGRGWSARWRAGRQLFRVYAMRWTAGHATVTKSLKIWRPYLCRSESLYPEHVLD
jgi:hypothetical protein